MALPATKTITATILSGASQSDILNVAGYRIVGVLMPSAWTTAAISYLGSLDGTNFYNYWNESGEFNIRSASAVASRFVELGPGTAFPQFASYIKLRSGTSGTPVNQAADRVLTVYLRQIGLS